MIPEVGSASSCRVGANEIACDLRLVGALHFDPVEEVARDDVAFVWGLSPDHGAGRQVSDKNAIPVITRRFRTLGVEANEIADHACVVALYVDPVEKVIRDDVAFQRRVTRLFVGCCCCHADECVIIHDQNATDTTRYRKTLQCHVVIEYANGTGLVGGTGQGCL